MIRKIIYFSSYISSDWNDSTLDFLEHLRKTAPEFFYRHLTENLGLRDSTQLMWFCKGLAHVRVIF